MASNFDRSLEDIGNSVGLEHVNTTVPDQQLATIFYGMGLGLTRDPYLVTGVDNMWMNVGRSQFHLPTQDPQVLRGHTGIVLPDREALLQRLASVKKRLGGTRFAFTEREAYVEATSPWGNRIRCHAPDEERFGRIVLGMPYVEFDVPVGTAAGIIEFYRRVILTPGTVAEDSEGRYAKVMAAWDSIWYFAKAIGRCPTTMATIFKSTLRTFQARMHGCATGASSPKRAISTSTALSTWCIPITANYSSRSSMRYAASPIRSMRGRWLTAIRRRTIVSTPRATMR